MSIKLGINGFGRIGRNILRAIHESGRDDIEVIAINDLGPVEMNAHLLKYDSVHGRFDGAVSHGEGWIDCGSGKIRVSAEADPVALNWQNVDVALECTGRFTTRESAARHLENGSARVLVSAPCKGADKTIVKGVNETTLTKGDLVISNGSCTTNCLAPVAKVLNDTIGILSGLMTTVHSYTGDQPVLDRQHSDPYRGRAAGMNMIPTSTGAARAIGLVLPELDGVLDGTAIRVPTPNVSCVDLTFLARRDSSAGAINAAIKEAASAGPLKGILGYSQEPLVSTDFNHDPRSSIFASLQTRVKNGTMVRILSWYDNEWGFSNRMCDTAVEIMART